MKNKLLLAILVLAVITVWSSNASAQNMSNTVKTTNVKFAAGKNQTTIKGSASYAMSYVYKFKVKKGQTVSIKATTKEPDLTFSVFSPDENAEELAFNVQEWTGETAMDGTYSMTLVMNNENAKNVPYSLSIKIE